MRNAQFPGLTQTSFGRWSPLLLLFCLAIGPLTAETWEIGDDVFEQVVVQEVNPETVVIRHQRGIASIPLRDLSPEMQVRFGYDSEAARNHRADQQKRQREARERLAEEAAKLAQPPEQSSSVRQARPIDRVLERLQEPASFFNQVDLRENYNEFNLWPRDQGQRPSCSVFAVVSALEYALAVQGRKETLSEEYLIWATLQYLNQYPEPLQTLDGSNAEPADIGFPLMAVVYGAQWFGIALESEFAYRFDRSMREIPRPSDDLIERSRERRGLRAFAVTGDSPEVSLNQITHFLNERWPVVIGVRWPAASTMRERPVLHLQEPLEDYAHAVTLVGYQVPEGKPEEAVFFFRNSWGARWGIGGYGIMSLTYLLNNLEQALVIDVDPS